MTQTSFPLRNLHQIEMTSFCNLRCRYCPQYPRLPRERKHMDAETFSKALQWVYFFMMQHGQKSLNLAGIGESTIHPDFQRLVRFARQMLPRPFELVLATNGVSMTQELADFLAQESVTTFVSMHVQLKAAMAINMLSKAGALAGVSADPALASTNWAGQVDWPVTAPAGRKCPWITGGMGIVLSDGSVSRCAFDATGIGVFAHVNDDLTRYSTSPYKLCASCDQDPGVPLTQEQVA